MSGFRKAKQTQAALKLGIYGSAGDGKTVTASLIAEGLAAASGKEVAFIDTEYGTAFYRQDVPERKFHPSLFDFNYLDTRSITEIAKELRGLDQKKTGVVVIDSTTHVWEACKAAYTGRTTKAGTIPLHAWGAIKKPWRDLIAYLLSSPFHVILCGREGLDYESDPETGESRVVGHKFKAEGETAYECHILIRMEGVRDPKTQEKVPTAFVEKDRTGLLMGKVITLPNFDTIAKPILHLLGGTQARIPTEDEVAVKDSEEMERQKREETTKSASLKTQYIRAFAACETKADVAAIAKQLTPEVKKDFLKEDLDAVREAWEKATEATTA